MRKLKSVNNKLPYSSWFWVKTLSISVWLGWNCWNYMNWVWTEIYRIKREVNQWNAKMITFVTFIVYNCIAFFESFIKQDFAHCTFSIVVLSDGYLLSALWVKCSRVFIRTYHVESSSPKSLFRRRAVVAVSGNPSLALDLIRGIFFYLTAILLD